MTTQVAMGLRIKKLREEKELSQTTLAELVGYKDKTAIAKIEAGKVDLPQSKILSFANALNTTTSFLFGDADKEPAASSTLPPIMEYFNQLNDAGKAEATKRVEELTFIPHYTEDVEKMELSHLNTIEGVENKNVG